jgi:hypothetical protein
MSQYEGWNNRETFMVASLIDNDREYLKLVLDAVERYMVNGMEAQIPERIAFIVTQQQTPHTHFNGTQYKLRKELYNLIQDAFFEEVVWDELAEHYKAKYVENLINDKDVLDEIAKGKDSKYHSEPNLNPDIKDPIMDIMQSIDDKPSA